MKKNTQKEKSVKAGSVVYMVSCSDDSFNDVLNSMEAAIEHKSCIQTMDKDLNVSIKKVAVKAYPFLPAGSSMLFKQVMSLPLKDAKNFLEEHCQPTPKFEICKHNNCDIVASTLESLGDDVIYIDVNEQDSIIKISNEYGGLSIK